MQGLLIEALELNITKIDWNLVAAGISAFGTVAAAIAAQASKKTAEKALQLQDRQYIFESLRACAERANASAKGKSGSEWSKNDAADIIRCLVRAMDIIKQACHKKEDDQMVALKQYFVNLLIAELYEEVHNRDAPDSVFEATEPTRILDGLWSKWKEAVDFFDIWDYPIATDEDLAD